MSMNDIIDNIKKSNNIILLCHQNPDGDAIGSMLALYHTLKDLNKDVDMVIDNPPPRFSFINGYEDIKTETTRQYDLGIVVDTANKDRIGSSFNLEKVKTLIVIDHHISNTKYGDINYIAKAPACCEIIYNLIKNMNIKINKSVATAICTGLLTDTGGFAHQDVTSNTFLVASQLSDIINISDIYKKVLQTITKSQFELKRIALDNLELYENDKIAFSYITDNDINSVGATREECDILVNIPMEISSVEVSIFVRIYDENTRVSLRSTNIDVNKIASIFGGGGHINASGITTEMDYQILKKKLIEETRKELNEWNISSK